MLTPREGMPRNAGPDGSPAHKPGSDTRQGSAGGTGTLGFRGGHSHVNTAALCRDAKWALVPGGVQALEKLSMTQ